MRRSAWLFIALLSACVGHNPLPSGLYGTAPVAPVPAPEFSATNRDGGVRTRDALVGHPTVIWFYPAAATAG